MSFSFFFFLRGRRWWWNNSVEDSLSPPALGCCGPSHSDGTQAAHQSLPPPLLLTFTRHLSDRLDYMIFSDGTVLYLNLNCFEMMEHMIWVEAPSVNRLGSCCDLQPSSHRARGLGSGSIFEVTLVALNCFLFLTPVWLQRTR